jgi:hypothetical protein
VIALQISGEDDGPVLLSGLLEESLHVLKVLPDVMEVVLVVRRLVVVIWLDSEEPFAKRRFIDLA